VADYASQGEWKFTAPPGTYILGLFLSYRGMAANGWVPDISSIYTDGTVSSFEDLSWDGQWWRGADSGRIAAVSIRLVCVVQRCIGAAEPFVYARDFRIFVADVTPPVVSSFGGSLVDSGTVSGVQSATVSASDQGGGVRKVYLKVNGTVMGLVHSCDIDRATSVARRFNPCPSTVGDELLVDTGSDPFVQGANRVQACVEDLADAGRSINVTCTPTQTVNVSRGSSAASRSSTARTPLTPGLHEAGS
jgi:hypothetical protein